MPGFRRNRKANDDDAGATTPLLASDAGAATPLLASDYDTASSWAEEEDHLSREKLQIIKARTMYEMVEEVELRGGPCKLLFLTNGQAELLARSDASLQKMLDALEVPKPQLVINLLQSQGFRANVNEQGPGGFDGEAASSGAGVVSNRPPFLTKEEEQAAERRIDRFMADVLIPLAAQTSAVVITSPFTNSILTSSLMRMHALQRSKWGGRPPYTIIAAGASIPFLYHNRNAGACWREVRRQSRAWRSRDKKLLDLFHQLHAKPGFGGLPPESHTDVNPNCSCIITTDMVEAKKGGSWDKAPFNELLTNLVRYLGSNLPSLTLKTGACDMLTLGEAGSAMSSLDVAVDTAESGSPVVFLDVRERPRAEAADRAGLIEAAKAALGAHCDALVAVGLAESLACSTIAYLHEVLFGLPDYAAETSPSGAADTRPALHEAIRRASEGAVSRENGAQGLQRATPQQITELAAWLADRYFRDAFAVLQDRAEREARGEAYETLYEDRIQAMRLWTESILASPNFQAVGLADPKHAARVIARVVRLDRLPKQNPLEGLMLLQEAWESHDVAVHLANYYKRLSKCLFALQLFAVWAVTVCTALGGVHEGTREGEPGREGLPYSEAAFFLAVVVSLIISIDGLLNAKSRWRQLRAGAGSLESMIWCYRTRVGDFELTGTDLSSLGPETNMRQALVAWRRNLMASNDLKQSGLSRAYPPSAYTHHQFPESGPLGAGDADDHYSPVQPQRYIEMRVLPSIAFYKQRTPWYAREGFLLKAAIVLSTLASGILSRYKLAVWVVGVTSAASALTSWQEYADAGRKTTRYAQAATELQNVLSWWKSTSEVERASKAAIARLIHTAEGVISEERLAWMSTASNQHVDDADSPKMGSEARELHV